MTIPDLEKGYAYKIIQQFEQHRLVCEDQMLDIDIVYFSLSKK